jgi:hypothetical protein
LKWRDDDNDRESSEDLEGAVEMPDTTVPSSSRPSTSSSTPSLFPDSNIPDSRLREAGSKEVQYHRIQARERAEVGQQRGNLFRLLNELTVFLLGGLLLLLSISGRLHVPRGSAALLLLGALLIYWGARIGMRPSQVAVRIYDRLRAISFVAAGLVILNTVIIPYRYNAAALGVAGGILALRGLATAVYVVRQKKAA